MGKIHSAALALLLLGSASAGAVTLPKDAEASLLVTGSVEVGADGTLLHHAIDHPEKLDAGVLSLIDRSMATWRFKPMTSSGNATMRLVLRATHDDSGNYKAWVDSADFQTPQDGGLWSYGRHEPPDYPREALVAGVGGTVYLYLHVNPDGKVIDVVAAQVDLYVAPGRPDSMNHWREILGNAAAASARAWRFNPPANPASAAGDASEAASTIMVPVSYTVGGLPVAVYGRWRGYMPGPRHQAPWLSDQQRSSLKNPEAVAANELYPVQQGPLELTTPLAAN